MSGTSEPEHIFQFSLEDALAKGRMVPPLSREDIHLWFGSVDSLVKSESLEMSLSSEEEERADHLSSAKLKARFVASRGVVRTILGLYSGSDPRSLSFARGRHGKPRLPISDSEGDVRFNVSNSGPCLACAVARGREVGVDIEHVRRFDRMDGFVERFFSELEKEEFRCLKRNARTRRFYEVWTAKEAYLKGTGEGLARDTREVSVLRESQKIEGAYVFSGGRLNRAPWVIYRLEPAVGLVGSLAIRSAPDADFSPAEGAGHPPVERHLADWNPMR